MKALSFLFAFAFSISLAAQDTAQAFIYFEKNSAMLTYEQTEQYDFLYDVKILSIEGYASAEGNSKENKRLARQRINDVRYMFAHEGQIFKTTAHGSTKKFGSVSRNRVVVVTYITRRRDTGFINHPEAFNCGIKIDGSIYFREDNICDIAIDYVNKFYAYNF